MLQNSLIRLLRALDAVTPQSTRKLGWPQNKFDRELLKDVARHYQGPLGHARHHQSGVVEKPGEKRVIPDVADPAPDSCT